MEDNKEKAPSDVEDHKEPVEAIKVTRHIKCEDTETIKEIYLSSSEIKKSQVANAYVNEIKKISNTEVDSALEKFSKLHDNQICTKCGNANHRANALYCHKCGKKL